MMKFFVNKEAKKQLEQMGFNPGDFETYKAPDSTETILERQRFIEDNFSWLQTWLEYPMDCHAPLFFFGPDVQKQYLHIIKTPSIEDESKDALVERHSKDVLYECVFSRGTEEGVSRRMHGFVELTGRLPNECDRFQIGLRTLSCFMKLTEPFTGNPERWCSSEVAICPRDAFDAANLFWKTPFPKKC